MFMRYRKNYKDRDYSRLGREYRANSNHDFDHFHSQMSYDELLYLYDIPKKVKGGLLANLGCFRGHSASALALGLKDAVFHASYFGLFLGVFLKLIHSPFIIFAPGFGILHSTSPAASVFDVPSVTSRIRVLEML